MKGGIGSNNLEANARLCMASAVSGFMTSFGLDEPMGCYEDIDHADVFILWGNNMAECTRSSSPGSSNRQTTRRGTDHRPCRPDDPHERGGRSVDPLSRLRPIWR